MKNFGYKNTIYLLIASVLTFLLLSKCKPVEYNVPKTPVIKLLELSQLKDSFGIDSVIKYNLSFTDGDGDLGLGNSDTQSPFRFGEPYFSNLRVILSYQDASNNWIEGSEDSLFLYQRIENVTPKGKYKSLKGNIQTFVRARPTPFFSHRKIKLKFILIDRSLNQSNIIETGEISLKHEL